MYGDTLVHYEQTVKLSWKSDLQQVHWYTTSTSQVELKSGPAYEQTVRLSAKGDLATAGTPVHHEQTVRLS